MGIIPRGESPWGGAPTIRFGMAADAINVSETTYLTVVRYYLANLGTTMESQVRSSRCTLTPVVPSAYSGTPPTSVQIYQSLTPSSFPCALLCATLLSSLNGQTYKGTLLTQVAARQSRTRILAVTLREGSYGKPSEITRAGL